MSRIAIISDTHLREVTPDFQALYEGYLLGADIVVHAGDIVSEKILDYLSERPLKAVRGNMDPPRIQELLPKKMQFEVDGFKFGLIHGWGAPWDLPRNIMGEFEGVHAVIFGHTHEPFCEFINGVLYFNPGSAGLRGAVGYKGEGTIGVIETQQGLRPEIIRL